MLNERKKVKFAKARKLERSGVLSAFDERRFSPVNQVMVEGLL